MQTWFTTPRARTLLAECVANPPATRCSTFRYGRSTDTDLTYTGKRVGELRRIRDEHMAASLAEGDRTGDYAEFRANCATVEEVVEAALSAAVVRVAA